MGEFVDLTGKRFGKLVVISYHHSNNATYWLCQCDCGNTTIVKTGSLNYGSTRSCGCGSIEQARENLRNHAQRGHGFANKEKLYSVWKGMRERCNNPNNKRYKNYGGRGIKICPDWNDYTAFRKWAIENGYSENLTIERIDINKGYCPENCRWATWKEQAQNTTRTRFLTYNGKTQSMSMWAKELGLSYGVINHRVQRGWSIERIANIPVRRSKNAT